MYLQQVNNASLYYAHLCSYTFILFNGSTYPFNFKGSTYPNGAISPQNFGATSPHLFILFYFEKRVHIPKRSNVSWE